MALCAPVLHVTSWQNAVKAVSGEETLEEVMSDWIGIFLLVSSSVDSGFEDLVGGKQVSALTGAEGW